MESDGNELQYIYSILRVVNQICTTTMNGRKDSIETRLFSNKFILKLLDQKLARLDSIATVLVSSLFKRLTKRTKRTLDEQLVLEGDLAPIKCFELDEYFHQSLYNLYNFVIEFDWHKPLDFDNLPRGDRAFVRTKLTYLNNFILFRELLLTREILQTEEAKEKPLEERNKSLKSSLILGRQSSSRTDSPATRRRVRFDGLSDSDYVRTNESLYEISRRNLKETHSILALELLIYSQNVFVQCMLNELFEWTSSSAIDLKGTLTFIKNSKQKIRVNQLTSISRQIKNLIDVYLSILSNIASVKKEYLIDEVLEIVCAHDSARLLKLYKIPRVDAFFARVELDAERTLLVHLVENCSQLLLDLITSEINLPPIEFNTETSTRSREEMTKSRDNYLNFISSWLNIDDIVFGHIKPKKKVSMEEQPQNQKGKKDSTLANAVGGFRSSSRILGQMDNLTELIRVLMSEVTERLQTHQQLLYFFKLMQFGINQAFDTTSNQLSHQFDSLRRFEPSVSFNLKNLDQIEGLNQSVDSIALKIRCLKCIHIFSSISKIVREFSTKSNIELQAQERLDLKLAEFSNEMYGDSEN